MDDYPYSKELMNPFGTTYSKTSPIGLVLPIAVGLLVAQTIATGFVFRSNLHLEAALSAIEAAGYLPLPNQVIAATLKHFGPAFWGGLLYTLSIGTGLTLVTWAVLHAWHHWLHRKRIIMVAIGIVWLGLFGLVNFQGPALFPSFFIVLTPLATGWVSLRVNATASGQRFLRAMIPVLTLVALTTLWSTQLDKQLFTGIRDHILLSNPVGRSVNDFYYRYTLYAAEAFKTFNQKTLKTAHIKGPADSTPLRQLQRILARYDVLVVHDAEDPDITLALEKDRLRLEWRGTAVAETGIRQFAQNPTKHLAAFSKATDRYSNFRMLTLVGLLVGFPVLLFILVYAGIKTGTNLVMGDQRSVVTASALCMFIGIALFLPMLKARPMMLPEDAIADALADPRWTRRVTALRQIHSDQIDITRYPQYAALVDTPLVVERYWLARAMAHSRADAAYHQLLALMADSHPNVVCQAYYALGRQGRKTAVTPILEQLAHSSHWYAQWYGYGALKRLGWRQKQSQ